MSETAEVQHQLLTHLIDAAALKSDVENLKANAGANNARIIEMLGVLTSKVEGLQTALNAVPDRISACRDEMRREVDKDFPSQVDAIAMERRIEKQVRDGDLQLTHQLTEATAGLNSRMDKIERKIDTLLIKIAVGMAVGGLMLMLFLWVIDNVSPAVLKSPPVAASIKAT